VGLDVVRANIDALKGSVHIEQSASGQGTTFVIRMPLTLAVMRALLFRVNGRLYATALYDIQEMLRVDPGDLKEENGRIYLKLGERQLPFYQLGRILAPGTGATPVGEVAQRQLVLIIQSGEWQGAVAIDSMHSQREIVIKSLGVHLGQVKGINGATVMGDGKLVPILNLEELLASGLVYDRSVASHYLEQQRMVFNVMVVDDSVSVRAVVSRLMQRQGWQVQTANDGVDAIEKLRDYRPDIILLDVEMPRMNGYEFMNALRSQDAFRDLPVVMLTSRSAKKHRDKARESGVNGYVVKPYEDEALLGLVQKLINPM
jgi:chemosensory pili system protein ChpA (sensor histidine kinase/response regulator)